MATGTAGDGMCDKAGAGRDDPSRGAGSNAPLQSGGGGGGSVFEATCEVPRKCARRGSFVPCRGGADGWSIAVIMSCPRHVWLDGGPL